LIVYKDIIGKLKSIGITTYTIRQQGLISQKTLTAIRNNDPINTKTIDSLCCLLNCQPGDLLEYIEDSPEE